MKIKKIAITSVNILGIAILIFGIMICIVGIAMTFDTSSPQSRNGASIAMASLAFMLPGLLLIMICRRSRKRLDMLMAIAGVVSSYRRITPVDLAARLMIPAGDAARLLAIAISQGLVKGKVDRATGEFYTEDGASDRVSAKFCSSCGAPVDGVVLKGETAKCRSCGNVIS
jgi:hypothetical protein